MSSKHGRNDGAARVAWCCALVVGAALCLLEPTSTQAAPPEKPQACVQHRAEARYSGVGYDHWVHLTNNCDSTVVCQVRTNVNPQATSVKVEPKASESVLTWRGSPAREFTATVDCHYVN